MLIDVDNSFVPVLTKSGDTANILQLPGDAHGLVYSGYVFTLLSSRQVTNSIQQRQFPTLMASATENGPYCKEAK